MERHVDLNEISDGNLYGLDDMVRADCAGCAGCSACCRGMGNSVVLDPLDVHRISSGLSVAPASLFEGQLELNVVDGLILPNLSMKGPGEACRFLNQDGRCTIHSFRPGICRIFPLGRYYTDGGFRYFLQIHECKKELRAKVKVKKWIDTENPKQYDRYILCWHDFLKTMRKMVADSGDEIVEKTVCMYILKKFYTTPYDREHDFYEQFMERIREAENIFGIVCS